MNRREFIRSAGALAFLTIAPAYRRLGASDDKSLVIEDAYSMWYNRPALAETTGGFCLGYISSSGEIIVATISEALEVVTRTTLHKFHSGSDHGSPAVITIPSGKHAGRVLACFSNHSSPLLSARSNSKNLLEPWDAVRTVDSGRSTYASMCALHDGRVMLMHTLQDRAGSTDATEWRKTVVRTTDDGGDSWTQPLVLASYGPGTFPYSTALAISDSGKLSMAYAVYRSKEKRHDGLRVIYSSDSFLTRCEIDVDIPEIEGHDTVPFETRWISENLIAVSYSKIGTTPGSASSRLVLIDIDSESKISDTLVADVEFHSYAGGASISEDGDYALYSPLGGGLVLKNIISGSIRPVIGGGDFSSPSLIKIHGVQHVVALKNPKVVTTLNFSSDVIVKKIAML